MSRAAFAAWRRADGLVLQITRAVLFVLGAIFVVAVSIEVFSRLFLQTSVYYLHSLTLFLLVWFFMLGAGLALREKAHVGFDLVVENLPAWLRGTTIRFAQLAVLAFFLLMIWSGLATLRPAMQQVDSSLGISNVWVMLALPIGFFLLAYHQIAAMVIGAPQGAADRSFK